MEAALGVIRRQHWGEGISIRVASEVRIGRLTLGWLVVCLIVYISFGQLSLGERMIWRMSITWKQELEEHTLAFLEGKECYIYIQSSRLT